MLGFASDYIWRMAAQEPRYAALRFRHTWRVYERTRTGYVDNLRLARCRVAKTRRPDIEDGPVKNKIMSLVLLATLAACSGPNPFAVVDPADTTDGETVGDGEGTGIDREGIPPGT